MTEPEKNNKRTKINVDSFVSNYMNTINSSDPAKSTSDGNTIFTEETESSMLTILRNSRRENIFDGRIKQYYKDKFFNKKGERNTTPRSRRYISKNKCFTFCKLRYKLSRNLIIVLGVLFILVSFGGIFLFLLLPKIAEILIRRSDLIIKEVDILKIGRQNGDPSFEINSIVNFGKSSSISSIKFIHSLLKISYSISSDENNMITRPLGELFISKVLARKNGDYFAKSRFTITNNDSLEALIKYYTSNIDNNDKPNIGLAGNRNIMFNTKGLMSLKIFGIRIDNIIIDKNINSNSIKNNDNDNDNKIKSLSFDNNDDNNIIIHNKWISVYGDGDIRINFEIETNVSKLLSKNQVHINQQDKKFMPSIVMNNIGDVWFNVFISDKLICRIIWFDFNIKSERNIWVFSIDFPDKISDKLMEDIINAIINDNNESNITLTIAGNYSENDAFNEIIKKINIKLPLKTLLNLLESEINNQKIVGSNILNKVIRYIKVGGVEFLNDSKSLKMRGNIGVGYVNPIGDSLPIIVNNISFNSVLSDELENNYGNIHLYLKKKPEVNMRKLSDKSNHSKNTVIELLYNDNLSVSSSNIKHKINSKYKIPIKETAETNKHNNHIEKCTNEKIKKENRHLLLKPCYNINEFEMELSIDTDKVKYEIKNEWIENVVSRRRKLALKNSVLNLNITSIFGNSLLKNIRIKRNLLNNKNKIKFTDNNQAYIDDDDYNFDDYYKDEDDELESNGENSKNLDIKNMSKLININDMKILGEGYNNSWITKLTIDEVNIFDKFGVNKLEIGSLGFIVSYNNETIGFMGTNDFKIGGNTKLTLIGVIKPEVDSTTNEINKSIVNIINSVLKGNISEIQDKSLTLEFKANQEEKEMCVKYFNYTKYLTDEDVNYWFKNKKLPILSEISEKNNSNNKRNWFEKFLNGQKINIPLNLLNEMYDFNIQKYVDKIVDNNTDIINNSLCFVQSLLNEDIMINEQNKKSVNGLSEIVSNKLKEYNIKISNASFQIFMATRESDLIIPINGLFSINIPRLITKNLFVNILYINYKLEFYDKDRKQKILSFDYFQNFNNINNEIINGTSINIVENKDFNLNVKIDNTEIILEDQNGQLMNIIKTIFGLPKSENEQVNNIELRSYISIGIQASIGIIKLNDIELYSTIRIPNCRKRLMKMEDKLNRQININSIFKVESIQVQKIRLIIPPRGIDIQLNTVINIPNYIDNLIFDIIVGQCIFELKNNDDHLLAIVKTPKQIIIGNNRKTEPICHGFIPAKSWLPMMNLLGNEDNTERIHIKAINTPHGVPYWLVSIFDYYKLPASKTFSSLDATEFSSVTFS